VPRAVKAVWLAVHGVLAAIAFVNGFMALTRPLRRRPKEKEEDDADGDAARYAGQARRRAF